MAQYKVELVSKKTAMFTLQRLYKHHCNSAQSSLCSRQHLQTEVTVHWGYRRNQYPLSGTLQRSVAGSSQWSGTRVSQNTSALAFKLSVGPLVVRVIFKYNRDQKRKSTFERGDMIDLGLPLRHPQGDVQQAVRTAKG